MDNLIWLRTSLRCTDNPLWQMAGADRPQNTRVVVATEAEQYRQHGYGQRRIDYRQRQVANLVHHLRQAGVTLYHLDTSTYQETADAILTLARRLNLTRVCADREYGLNERHRDHRLQQQLTAYGISLDLVDDRLTQGPDGVLTRQGTPYKVYSAYRNAWLARWQTLPQGVHPRPQWLTRVPPLEQAALDQLDAWTRAVHAYAETRNELVRPTQSGLSVAAANGLITTRQALAAVPAGSHEGARVWAQEWLWREFFLTVGWHFPAIYRGHALQAWTDRIAWPGSADAYDAWREGRTGYPLVDAAMRQLAATGQMPNRVRMVAAAFLVKDLQVDWRRGEAWFLENLHDADFAVNNGNWQWNASTGVDAAPYFRIFNPERQAERFDPEAEYIQTWVPELARLPARQARNPDQEVRQTRGYPPPLVIHKDAALRTRSLYDAARKTTGNSHDRQD